MKKEVPTKYQEVNRLLQEIRNLLPEIEFRYSPKTDLLESVHFSFPEDRPLDLNFFDSLPRSYPTPNLLRRSHSSARPPFINEGPDPPSINDFHGEIPYPRPRGSSGITSRKS